MSMFRYPGGKKRRAKHIVHELTRLCDGRITDYGEPFLGGGSIGLALLRSHSGIERVRINDADPGVASFWTAVLQRPGSLKDRIREFSPSVDAFYQFKADLGEVDAVPAEADDIVEVGFEKLALNRISFSGLGAMAGGPLGGRHQLGNRGIASRWNPERLCREIDDAHDLFSKVEVVGGCCTCRDFEELVDHDEESGLAYLDPPFYKAGPMLYQRAFTQDDHERLAAVLRGSRHRWLLSYDDAPAIRDLYDWADIQEVQVGYSVNGCHRTRELLIAPRHEPCASIVGDGLGSPSAAASVTVPAEVAPVKSLAP